MNWQNITDLPDKATIPVNLAFTAIGVEDQRAALLKIAAKGITLLEEREIPLIVRETLAMIRANSLSGQPAHDDKVELVPVPSIDRYLIESDLLAHLYISKEDLLAVREELQRDNAPAGDHEKPVIGWKKLEAAFGKKRGWITEWSIKAGIKIRYIGRSPALMPSEIVAIKAFRSEK